MPNIYYLSDEFNEFFDQVFDLAGLPRAEYAYTDDLGIGGGVAEKKIDGRIVVWVSRGSFHFHPRTLRALIAHEVAHVKNGDLKKRFKSRWATGFLAVSAFLNVFLLWAHPYLTQSLMSLASITTGVCFGSALAILARLRNSEFAADEVGAQIIDDREAMIHLLEMVKLQENKLPWKRFLSLLNTHPPTEDRIQMLKLRAPLASNDEN